MNPIEIFRAGAHRAMSGDEIVITAADLAEMAATYDPALHEAPIVVGHPTTDAPAYGWIGSLAVDGDLLIATPTAVDPAFAEMVAAGRFRKRSASFYAPTTAGNPTPGKWSLKHVGFLGAVPPVVKGLRNVAFASADGAVEFADWSGLTVARLFGSVREFLIAQFGAEKADQALPASDIDQLRFDAAQADMPDTAAGGGQSAEPARPQTQQFGEPMTAPDAALKAREDKLAADQVAFAERQAIARRHQFGVFVDGLIAAGKVATGHKAPLIAFMETIPAGDSGAFEFSEGGHTARADATEWFKGFLDALRPIVPQGQAAPHRPGESFAEANRPALDPAKTYASYNARP